MINIKNSRGLGTDYMIWTGMKLVTSWNEGSGEKSLVKLMECV